MSLFWDPPDVGVHLVIVKRQAKSYFLMLDNALERAADLERWLLLR